MPLRTEQLQGLDWWFPLPRDVSDVGCASAFPQDVDRSFTFLTKVNVVGEMFVLYIYIYIYTQYIYSINFTVQRSPLLSKHIKMTAVTL